MDVYVGILLATLGVLIPAVGVGVSIVVWGAAKRKSRAEYSHAMQVLWNQVNLASIASDENLKIAEWLLSYDSEPLPYANIARCKYMAFLSLNAINAAFLADRDRVGDTAYATQNINQLLPRLLMKDFVYELTQTRGYSPAFQKLCMEMRNDPSDETREGIAEFKSQALLSGTQNGEE